MAEEFNAELEELVLDWARKNNFVVGERRWNPQQDLDQYKTMVEDMGKCFSDYTPSVQDAEFLAEAFSGPTYERTILMPNGVIETSLCHFSDEEIVTSEADLRDTFGRDKRYDYFVRGFFGGEIPNWRSVKDIYATEWQPLIAVNLDVASYEGGCLDVGAEISPEGLRSRHIEQLEAMAEEFSFHGQMCGEMGDMECEKEIMARALKGLDKLKEVNLG